MSLIIFDEPKFLSVTNANQLEIGSWFISAENQILVLVLDDRTNERRIVCLSEVCKPFISNIPINKISVRRVLNIGTLLQLSSSIQKGE